MPIVLQGKSMLKMKPKKSRLNIGIVLDESSSMQGLKMDAIKSLNAQIKSHQEEASKNGIDAVVTVTTFASFVNSPSIEKHPLKDVGEFDSTSYNPNGMTALNDAIGNMLERLPIDSNNMAYLIVITDGEENNSKNFTVSSLRDLIESKLKTDRLTIAACVPPLKKAYTASITGIPVDCIIEWEATSRGVERMTQSIRSANTSMYTNSYSIGATCTKSYFSPDVNNLTPSVVNTNLDDLSKDVRIFNVLQKEAIASFVSRQMNKPYSAGIAYYQLTKNEKVQSNKDILLRDKNNGKVYGGDHARSLLRIPSGGNIELNPASSPDYEVYVLSTSHNRNLLPNTKVIVKK